MKIERFLQTQIENTLLPGKVLILYGPRQVGKTTLVHSLIDRLGRKTRFVNADELLTARHWLPKIAKPSMRS